MFGLQRPAFFRLDGLNNILSCATEDLLGLLGFNARVFVGVFGDKSLVDSRKFALALVMTSRTDKVFEDFGDLEELLDFLGEVILNFQGLKYMCALQQVNYKI